MVAKYHFNIIALLKLLESELKKYLHYRFDFWFITLAFVPLTTIVAFYIWSEVFVSNQIEAIGSLNLIQVVFYYLLAGYTVQICQRGGEYDLQDLIYTGKLNKELLYPVPIAFQILSKGLALALINISIAVPSVIIFLLLLKFPAELLNSLNLIGIVQAFIMLGMGIVFSRIASTILNSLAFWINRTWTISFTFFFVSNLFSGALIPLDLMPNWLLTASNFLPFKNFCHVPVMLILGKYSTIDFISAVSNAAVWSVIFLIPTIYVWRRGLRVYTGVGI